MQLTLLDYHQCTVPPFKNQLLKWIGNKQRFAHGIVSYFPARFATYYEPFLGSGGVLAVLEPEEAVASDSFKPLMEIWRTLSVEPDKLKKWYSKRLERMFSGNKIQGYEEIKAAYNSDPNGADLLFLCRACYGGVVRFRKTDGYMSTPCGIHTPISAETFARRVDEWHRRTRGVSFRLMEYEQAMNMARGGDLVYCDPPYSHSQTILYGAQEFSLERLFEVIADCKSRGVFVALSIDGKKRSGKKVCNLSIPDGVFESEIFVDCGRSMLKRFQREGKTLEDELVADRLLLTY